jgi:hypothetical protein
MKSKAVLFGINYTHSPESSLRGCINDVKNMSSFLKNTAKYDVVKTYTDEDNISKVSGSFILNAIYKLAIDSHRYNLERVWIHYSGHGCSINDKNGDELDGKDECIVPADYKYRGVITDDNIKRVLRYFNKKTQVTCIFDCCHSGTIGDLKYEYKDPNICLVDNSNSKCNANIMLLSGCMDHQTSADAFNVQGLRQFSGAMTSCLLMAMKQSSNTFDVFKNVKSMLKSKHFTQVPRLTSSFKVNSSTCLF